VPSLDGLRAISIAAVLLGHLAGTQGFPAPLTDVVRHNGFVDVANLGVRVFFVISGFLITGLLVREHEQTGGIGLKRFYLRRTMRIFPAYYAFLLALVLFNWTELISVTPQDLAYAVSYTTNYYPDRSWDIGHLWSLAVEEQFYLLWPFAMIVLGLKNVRLAAIGVVVIVPFIRVAEYVLVPYLQPVVNNTFETTADALAMGCLLSLSFTRIRQSTWFERIVKAPWILVVGLAIALLLAQWGPTRLLVSITLLNFVIAMFIAYCIVRSDGVVGRVLNLRTIVYVGTLSYSIYLWQQIFLNRESTNPLASFPLNLGLVAICALASFYLVERPFLRWRPSVEQRLLGRPGGPASGSRAADAPEVPTS
jgi:peptidoglycan/LPS O-acetylase OafA/YrhL